MDTPGDIFLLLMNDVARLIRTEADKRARAHGMSRAQWSILVRLRREPGLSQRELAEILDVEPINVGRLVDRLEARGLVERRPDASDRRIWRLHLRDEADRVLAALEPQRASLVGLVVDGVDEQALLSAIDVLRQMRAKMSAGRRADAAAELADAG